jgi:hypothetical protein
MVLQWRRVFFFFVIEEVIQKQGFFSPLRYLLRSIGIDQKDLATFEFQL